MTKTKFVDPITFRDHARSGTASGLGVFGQARILKTPTDGSRTVSWVLSDGSVDRSGDTVSPAGWDLTDYKRNNIVLWSHDASQPPIGRATNVRSDGQRLIGDVEFAPPDVSAFADSVFRLVRGGFIKAGSVGFIPTDYAFSKDKNRPNGIDFKKQQLLEFSICSVPANANALAEARAKGLNVKPLMQPKKSPSTPQTLGARMLDALRMQEKVARMQIACADNQEELSRAYAKLQRVTPQLQNLEMRAEYYSQIGLEL